MGRESQEDFQNLFEGVDLYASQLGKTIEDKNRVVFNILDALGPVNFDLDKESRNNTLLSKSILENRKFNKDYSYSRKNERRLRSGRKNNIKADFKDLNSLVDEKMEYNLMKSNYALEADRLDHEVDEYS